MTYVSEDGTRTMIDVAIGTSVMQAALLDGVVCIIAECSGMCMCSSCYVYIRENQLSLMPPMREEADVMLDATASPRRANSRLSCQLTVQTDGLVVTMPERQG